MADRDRSRGEKPRDDGPGDHKQSSKPGSGNPRSYKPSGGKPGSYKPSRGKPSGSYGRSDYRSGGRPPTRPTSGRPASDRPRADRPASDRPTSYRPTTGRPPGDRPPYDRPREARPNDKPRDDRPRTFDDRPRTDRPAYGRPRGDRPAADRQYDGRPRDDRPRSYPDRPEGQSQDRPRGQQSERSYPARTFGDRPRRPPFDARRPYTTRPAHANQQRHEPPVDRDALVGEGEELIAGRRPVEEAFAARRAAVRLLIVPERRAALDALAIHATTLRIPVVEVEGGTLTSLAGFDGHQGVALVAQPRPAGDVDAIIARAKERGEAPFVLVLDSLEDPQNFGTLLRSAEACGMHGVIYPTRRSAPLSPAAIKASAGATEHLILAAVDDLAGTLADLHGGGLRLVGADEGASLAYTDADLRGPLAIIVGSEGQGMSGPVRRRLDLAVRIPMRGKIGSLNAAVAGSILLFAAAGQRPEPVPPVDAAAADSKARAEQPAEASAPAKKSAEAPVPVKKSAAEPKPAKKSAAAPKSAARKTAPATKAVPAKKSAAAPKSAKKSVPTKKSTGKRPGATGEDLLPGDR